MACITGAHMTGYGDDSELSRDKKNQLGDFIERLESLTAEKKIAAEKINAEYAEAASAGFDTKAIKQIIKDRLADAEKTTALRRTVDIYRKALSTFAATPLGDWARQWIANDARHEVRAKDQEAGPLETLMSGRKGSSRKAAAPPPEPEPEPDPEVEPDSPADKQTEQPDKRESKRDRAKRLADKYIGKNPPPAS